LGARHLDARGEAEVRDQGATVGVDENVVGLDVAVHQSLAVRGGDASGDLSEGVEELAGGPVLAPLGQGGPGDELHHEVDVGSVLAYVVDAHDVGMPQSGERFGLGEQSSLRLLAGVAYGHHLDRDLAIELRVVGDVHDAHAAGAEGTSQDVATEGVLGERGVVPFVVVFVSNSVVRRGELAQQCVASGTLVDVRVECPGVSLGQRALGSQRDFAVGWARGRRGRRGGHSSQRRTDPGRSQVRSWSKRSKLTSGAP